MNGAFMKLCQALMHRAFPHHMGHLAGMSEVQSSIRRYLEFVLSTTNMTPRQLALTAGVAPTTLTRFLNSDAHKFNISNSTLEKISTTTGLSISKFYSTLDLGARRSTIDARIEDISDKIPAQCIIPIEYDIDPGMWIEEDIYARQKHKRDIGLPPLKSDNSSFYSVVNGNSIDKYANSGEYLFCERLQWNGEFNVLRNGQIYIIERRAFEGRLVECSARVCFKVADSIIFEFASNDVDFEKATITYDKASAAAERLHVIGYPCSVVRRLGPKI